MKKPRRYPTREDRTQFLIAIHRVEILADRAPWPLSWYARNRVRKWRRMIAAHDQREREYRARLRDMGIN